MTLPYTTVLFSSRLFSLSCVSSIMNAHRYLIYIRKHISTFNKLFLDDFLTYNIITILLYFNSCFNRHYTLNMYSVLHDWSLLHLIFHRHKLKATAWWFLILKLFFLKFAKICWSSGKSPWFCVSNSTPQLEYKIIRKTEEF